MIHQIIVEIEDTIGSILTKDSIIASIWTSIEQSADDVSDRIYDGMFERITNQLVDTEIKLLIIKSIGWVDQ